MAIQFTSDLPSTQVLNAFNNNVVSFKSNSGTNALDATITISGIDAPSVSITPNVGGLFTYNFCELFKIMVNKNHFSDGVYDILAPHPEDYIISDLNVYKDLIVNYRITLEDGNTESVSRTYRVLRSVVKMEDYRRNLTNDGNSSLALLLPFVHNSNKTYHAKMFDGYPFDVAIYCNNYQNVTLRNKTTNYSLTVAMRRGVNRFFFSNGETNVTLDNLLPIALGVNEIEIYPALDSSRITLFLEKEEACTGHLLKWFNDLGGWCYFLFNKNKHQLKVKDSGDFTSNFKNIKDTKDVFTGLGYSKEETIELYAEHIDIDKKKLINTLFGSPKVYLYLKPPFQKAGEKDFMPVKVDTSKIEDNFRYYQFTDFFFEIYRPTINTMTL